MTCLTDDLQASVVIAYFHVCTTPEPAAVIPVISRLRITRFQGRSELLGDRFSDGQGHRGVTESTLRPSGCHLTHVASPNDLPDVLSPTCPALHRQVYGFPHYTLSNELHNLLPCPGHTSTTEYKTSPAMRHNPGSRPKSAGRPSYP